MRFLLIADQTTPGLAALTDDIPVSLLPVAGKSLLEHALDDLYDAGLRAGWIAISPFPEEIRRAVGLCERWNMSVEFVHTRGNASVESLISRLPMDDEPLLVVEADKLRTPVCRTLLASAGETPSVNLDAWGGGRRAGVLLVQDRKGAVERSERADCRVAAIDSPRAYHAACIEATRGAFDLFLPAVESSPGVLVGRRTALPETALTGGNVFVGHESRVSVSARIGPDSVIERDTYIDRNARVTNAVVLPGTYVGENVTVENAIVKGTTLLRIDSGAAVDVPDDFLLASLGSSPFGQIVESISHRAAGLLLLLFTLPFWVVALIAGLIESPRSPLFRERIPTGFDRWGGMTSVSAWCFATRVRWLRHLPRILRVVSGHLAFIGVAPATLAACSGEAWEMPLRRARAGLFSPGAAVRHITGSLEESRVADALYCVRPGVGANVRVLFSSIVAAVTIEKSDLARQAAEPTVNSLAGQA